MDYKTALVTGVSGFIGTHLVSMLRELFPSARIIGMARSVPQVHEEILGLDLLRRDEVFSAMAEIRPDYVFHLAGAVHTKDWEVLYRGNVEATINLLDALAHAGGDARIVIAGSAAEYGLVAPHDLPLTEDRSPNPVSAYGASKAWQTAVVRYYANQGMNVAIGRVFNIVGKGMSEMLSVAAFALQIRKIRNGQAPARLLVGNLEPRRDFVDVADVCHAFIGLAQKGRRGEIYNICSGSSVSIKQMLALMIEQAGIAVDLVTDPLRLKSSDIPDTYGSCAKISAEIGWTPKVSLEKSLSNILN